MTMTSTRTALKALLETVSGIGRIYDYKRYASDWGTYKSLFVKNSKVNEWEIQREGFQISPRGSQAVDGKVKDTTQDLIIRGFYAFQDVPSSEKEFDTLIDLITDEFIKHQDINGSIQIINIPVVGDISFGYLGEVLCHVVEIHLSVKERTFL